MAPIAPRAIACETNSCPSNFSPRKARNNSPINEPGKQMEEQEDQLVTMEQALAIIQQNSKLWDQLRRTSHEFNNEEKWSKHCSYIRFDFLSPSNYKSIDELKSEVSPPRL